MRTDGIMWKVPEAATNPSGSSIMDVAALDLVIPAVTAVILVTIVSGAVLLYPVSRRLAELLRWQIEEKKRDAQVDPSEIDRSGIEVRLSELEDQIAAVGERQQFLERLLEKGGPSAVPD